MSESLWWMFDNHTFRRIDDAPDLVTACARVLACVAVDPYGTLGTKGRERDVIIHARKDDAEGTQMLALVKEFYPEPPA